MARKAHRPTLRDFLLGRITRMLDGRLGELSVTDRRQLLSWFLPHITQDYQHTRRFVPPGMDIDRIIADPVRRLDAATNQSMKPFAGESFVAHFPKAPRPFKIAGSIDPSGTLIPLSILHPDAPLKPLPGGKRHIDITHLL